MMLCAWPIRMGWFRCGFGVDGPVGLGAAALSVGWVALPRCLPFGFGALFFPSSVAFWVAKSTSGDGIWPVHSSALRV